MTPFPPFENPTITFFVGVAVGMLGTLMSMYQAFRIVLRNADRMRRSDKGNSPKS